MKTRRWFRVDLGEFGALFYGQKAFFERSGMQTIRSVHIHWVTRLYIYRGQPLTIGFMLNQSWRRGKRTLTYGAADKLVMRIWTCLFIYLTRTQKVK